MTEEEKEAIEILEGFEPDDLVECAIYRKAINTITNLIQKQEKQILDLTAENLKLSAKALNEHIKDKQKSVEQLEALNLGWKQEVEKKEKIIDKMVRMINTHDIDEDICWQFGKNKDCSDYTNEELCIDCIKKYFERQVVEKKEKP